VTRRSRRALPATLTAFVLLAVSVLVAVCAIQLALGERPLLPYDSFVGSLHDTTWSAREVGVAGGIVAAIGLLLFLVAVVPGKARTAALDEHTAVSVRGLRSTAQVDGVESAAVKVRRRRVRAVVRTRRSVADGLDDAVRTALESRVSEFALARPPQVVVRVKALRSAS
jgi:hypothetical protein